MERKPLIELREVCPECDGSGEPGGVLTEGERMEGRIFTRNGVLPCPKCHGTGYNTRWVGLSELRDLLERTEQ